MLKYYPLFKESIFLKKLFEWSYRIKCTTSFLENLKLVYEFEYKYSMIEKTTRMNPERKKRILQIIENNIREVIFCVVHKLNIIFTNWLDAHQIYTHVMNFNNFIKLKYDIQNNKTTLDLNKLFNKVLEDYLYISKTEKKYNHKVELDFKNAEKNIENIILFIKEFVYPLYYDYFRKNKLEKIRLDINETRDKLNHIVHSHPIKEIFVELNRAINLIHHTGTIKDHIAIYTDATVEDLNKLSNISKNKIDKWNNDLQEMGIW